MCNNMDKPQIIIVSERSQTPPRRQQSTYGMISCVSNYRQYKLIYNDRKHSGGWLGWEWEGGAANKWAWGIMDVSLILACVCTHRFIPMTKCMKLSTLNRYRVFNIDHTSLKLNKWQFWETRENVLRWRKNCLSKLTVGISDYFLCREKC